MKTAIGATIESFENSGEKYENSVNEDYSEVG